MGAMQDSEHPNFALRLEHFVNRDERERREGDLARALDATRAPDVRERFQCADTLDQ